MGAHIVGRPNNDLLDIILGPGADPERALIGGSAPAPKESDDLKDELMGDEPNLPPL